jgi:hypothetical protein
VLCVAGAVGEVRQVLLALIFRSAFFQPTVFVSEVFQTAMADGQSELAGQPARAEASHYSIDS